ncbi:MAG: SWIM zinc finger family protein [bacterium]
MFDYFGWKPRPTVAARRRQAELEKAKLLKKGRAITPVTIQGRTIARTFWGKAWCGNLESYSDYANRLPRGRSYVRNGLVVHLEIAAGSISALVRGSSLYKVSIAIASVPRARWTSIRKDSGGAIDSIVELLQGRFPKAIMERISRQGDGLFPSPREIDLDCSCPDGAVMCKHVAAVLYGVGARLDEQPDLLFTLRRVDAQELISTVGTHTRLTSKAPSSAKVLEESNLSELFGLQLAERPALRGPKRVAKKGAKPKASAIASLKGTRATKKGPAKKKR